MSKQVLPEEEKLLHTGENDFIRRQERALRNLSWSVGLDVAGEIVHANGGAVHVADIIIGQHHGDWDNMETGYRFEDPDLSALIITANQREKIDQHRAKRDEFIQSLEAPGQGATPQAGDKRKVWVEPKADRPRAEPRPIAPDEVDKNRGSSAEIQ